MGTDLKPRRSARPSLTRPLWVAAGATLALVGARPAAARAALLAQETDPAVEITGFSIPNTRSAAALADRVEEHVAALRWIDTLVDLQALLDDHSGDVLRGRREAGGLRSQTPTFQGAGDYATDRLFGMPATVRREYAERYASDSSAALEASLRGADRRGLAEVTRRWPITPAAERAAWALGDLELEAGNVPEALRGWERALRVRRLDGDLELETSEAWAAMAKLLATEAESETDTPSRSAIGAGARVEFASAWLAGVDATDLDRRSAELTGQGPREAVGTPPSTRADAWSRPYVLPDHPFDRGNRGNLFPVRAEDSILVSTSLELISVNAYTGTEEWRTGEPRGWTQLSSNRRSEFFEAVDPEGTIAPAVKGDIAVAALQIPISHIEKDNFQRIQITLPIPDRRLFAFDRTRGGALLWDHMPSPFWDGDSGDFEERMSVAAPPVIVGTRVLAPYYRMRGRIDFHVACFDLATGELIWSTDVISGQRELNMFGRHLKEFCAPPLRVEGDRVIALTQLGSIAALDLLTGEILWETLYEQIPLERTEHFDPRPRDEFWSNAQPIVQDDVIVATPVDSNDMIGVDLSTGAMLWSLGRNTVRELTGIRRSRGRYALFGVVEDRVYLSGSRVIALQAPAGLRNGPPSRVEWVEDDPKLVQSGGGFRPVIGSTDVVISAGPELITVDRRNGRRTSLSGGIRAAGNLLLEDGQLFVLGDRDLQGFFEWEALLARAKARYVEYPNQRAAALELGRLLGQRGRADWDRGDTEQAGSRLREARAVLEPVLELTEGARDPRITEELHHILRAEAAVRVDLASPTAALALLREAREYAPDEEALLETMLEEERLLTARFDVERTVLLDELEARCEELSVFCLAAWDADERWPRLRPILRRDPDPQSTTVVLPVGLWVLIERARLSGVAGETARELEDLYTILFAYPDEKLPSGRAYDLAHARLGRRVPEVAPALMEPFEGRARDLMDRALRSGDVDGLSRISVLFPHTRAAHEANDHLFEVALADGDLETIAQILQSELRDPWVLERANDRERALFEGLARAAVLSGNEPLGRAMARRLREAFPGRPPLDLPEPPAGDSPGTRPGASLSVSADAKAPGFGYGILPHEHYTGRFEELGTVPGPDGERDRWRVFADDETIVVLAEDGESWSVLIDEDETPMYWTDRFVATPGRIVLATRTSVRCFDASTGDKLWVWSPPERNVLELSGADGVLVAVVDAAERHRVLFGLEATAGIQLWSTRVDAVRHDSGPLCGEGRVVLLPKVTMREVQVFDLFTGRLETRLRLPHPLPRSADRSAWIEAHPETSEPAPVLVLPHFYEGRSPETNHINAIDLTTGLERWKLSFADEAGRQLIAVLRHDGHTYLWVEPSTSGDKERPGLILELHTDLGARRRLPVELAPGDRLVGVPSRSVTELREPLVFVKSDGRSQTRLRALQLPGGERWTYSLPVDPNDLYPMPLPAVSETCVAFGYTELPRSGRKITTSLLLLDRVSGSLRDTLFLHRAHKGSDDVSLLPHGSALVVLGDNRLEIFRE